MILQKIYEMSLEHPGPGFCMFESLDELNAYIYGFTDCSELLGDESSSSEWVEFLEWLREIGYLPCRGWAKMISEGCKNTGESFSKFNEFLYEYIKIKKPKWFFEFNKQPKESRWRNVKGPRSQDIRKIEHMEWIKNS